MRPIGRLLAVTCTAAILLCLLAAVAAADIADCYDATCRVSTGDARGTGCVFSISNGHVFVLTNAHVVDTASSASCEFWSQGHQSIPIAGRVARGQGGIDAAYIAIPEASFHGRLPRVIPLAPVDTVLRAGEEIVSVGCAHAAWATGWKGHVLDIRGGQIRFLPPPAGGRSGSAICNKDGTRIVGLLWGRSDQDKVGYALPVQAIYQAITGKQTGWRASPEGYATEPSGCPGGNCPINIFGRQNAPQQQPQQGPYPTLPPVQALPQVPTDLSGVEARLDGISNKIDVLIGNTSPQPPQELVPEIPPVVSQIAMGLAERIDKLAEDTGVQITEVRGIAEANSENVDKLTTLVEGVSANQTKLTEAVGENGTLSQRFHARVDKIKEELGDEASKREVGIGYVKDMLAEKATKPLSALAIGLATGSPLAIGIVLLGIMFVLKDRKDRMTTGDPLLMEKIASRTPWGWDDALAAKIAQRVAPYTAPQPAPPATPPTA